LSYEEVNDLVKPTDEALDLLHEWLALNGITNLSYSPAKDWINIYVDVDTAERLLDTSYSIYEHADGTRLARTESWSLPKHLHAHIDTIQPTTSFMRPQAKKLIYKTFEKPTMPIGYKPPTNPEIAEVCTWNGTTPACFAALYGTKGYKQQVPGKNQIGFNNFLDEVPIRPDTAKFLSIYQPKVVKGAYNFKFVDIDNGPSQDGPLTPEQLGNNTSKEANLDVQTIVGMTYPMPVTAWSTGGEPPQIGDIAAGEDPGNEPYLAWANYVLAQKFVPQVISTSYGDDEQTVPIAYAKRVCNSFAQLGARGVSLLFASGDGGAGDIAGNDAEACVSNDGKNTLKYVPPSLDFLPLVLFFTFPPSDSQT
jgi:tripeptidyl-peptidase-1